jgi:hypothetical protein
MDVIVVNQEELQPAYQAIDLEDVVGDSNQMTEDQLKWNCSHPD